MTMEELVTMFIKCGVTDFIRRGKMDGSFFMLDWAQIYFKEKPLLRKLDDIDVEDVKIDTKNLTNKKKFEKYYAYKGTESCAVYIDGLTGDILRSVLQAYFSKFGELEELMWIFNAATMTWNKWAIVAFKDKTSRDLALDKIQHPIKLATIFTRTCLRNERIIASDSRYPFPQFLPNTIYVDGLTSWITKDMFESYFSQFGEVMDTHLHVSTDSSSKDNWATVDYADPKDVISALDQEEHEINAMPIEVQKGVEIPSCLLKDSKPEPRSIMLWGLNNRLTYGELRQYFSRFGRLVHLYWNYEDGVRRCPWAYLLYTNREEANRVFDYGVHIIKSVKVTPSVWYFQKSFVYTPWWAGMNPEKIYLKDLDESISASKISDYFMQFGEITEVFKRTADSDWAIVTFENAESVDKIFDAANHHISGIRLKCLIFHDKQCTQISTNNIRNGEIDLNSVYVAGFHEQTTERILRLYFERFGAVSKVVIDENLNSQKFSFVSFYDLEAVRKVLVNVEHTIGDEIVTLRPAHSLKSIHISTNKKQEDEIDANRVYLIGLHGETTKNRLREYFERFGAVSKVVIRENRNSQKWSIVSFDDPEAVRKVLVKSEHEIGLSIVTVRSCQTLKSKLHSTNKLCEGEIDNYSVFMGDLHVLITRRLLREYFEQFGTVSKIVIRENDKGQTWSIVSFDDPESVQRVLLKNEHKIGSAITRVRQGFKQKSTEDNASFTS